MRCRRVADDDRDDDDDDFAASGERRGETVAVVEATKSDGGFAKESTLFSIKDEADDEEQDAIARKLAVELAVEADDTRAKDVRVLRVSKAVYYARYVVLATAFNRPQMSAVTSKMRGERITKRIICKFRKMWPTKAIGRV